MKRLCLLAAVSCAALSVLAVSALAKPTPEIRPIAPFTDKGGEASLIGKGLIGSAKIKCSSSTSTGSFQTSLLGTFDILLRGCLVSQIILLLCTGLEDTVTSSELWLGTFHLRYRNGTSEPVIAYLLKPVHYTCVNGSTTILIEVTGCMAGTIGPTNTVIKLPQHYTMTLKHGPTETLNEITKIENETGTGQEACILLSKEGTGAGANTSEVAVDEIFPLAAESEIRA
jgi:hypothetical protein